MSRAALSCSILLLLCSAGFLAVRAEDGDDSTDTDEEDAFEAQRALLLVRKYAADQEIVKGSNTTVTIELYNAGNRWDLSELQCHPILDSSHSISVPCGHLPACMTCSVAQDVIVTEGAWPSQSFLVDEGSYEASFERIASGATVKHEYTVQAIEGPQLVRTEPATVFYKPEYGSQDVQVRQWVSSYLLYHSNASNQQLTLQPGWPSAAE